jgi:5-methylcytosine-specific restriction endonuclease McrA
MASEKRCVTCKAVKETSQFNKNRSTDDGFQHRCRECQRESHRAKRIAAGLKVRGPKQTKEERLALAREYNRRTNRSVIRRNRNYDRVLESERQSQRKWRENNPAAYKAKIHLGNSRRRTRLAGNGIYEINAKDMRRLLSQSCASCGAAGEHMDHIIPVSRGGHHAIGNLQMMCSRCNLSKHNKLSIEWRAYKMLVAA